MNGWRGSTARTGSTLSALRRDSTARGLAVAAGLLSTFASGALGAGGSTPRVSAGGATGCSFGLGAGSAGRVAAGVGDADPRRKGATAAGLLAASAAGALGAGVSAGVGDGELRRKGAAASWARTDASERSATLKTANNIEIFLTRRRRFLAAS